MTTDHKAQVEAARDECMQLAVELYRDTQKLCGAQSASEKLLGTIEHLAALASASPAPAASELVADEAMIRKALAPFVYDDGYVRGRFGLLDKENQPVLYTESFEQAIEGWFERRVKEPNEEFDIVGWNASVLVYHRDVERLYGPAKGTMECPICGRDTPHQHGGDEVSYHQRLVAQMQKADEAIRQNVTLRIAQINERYGKTPKLDAAVSAVMLLSQPPAASSDVLDAARWQPIATAPKDGTEILVWSEDGVQLVAWQGKTLAKNGKEGWCESGSWQDAQGGYATVDNPSAWMPLPTGPSDAAGAIVASMALRANPTPPGSADALIKALSAAQSALLSFAHGNASESFAKDMADNCAKAIDAFRGGQKT